MWVADKEPPQLNWASLVGKVWSKSQSKLVYEKRKENLQRQKMRTLAIMDL